MADNKTPLDETQKIGEGNLTISLDSTSKSPSVILKENGVSVVASNPSFGIQIDDSGIMIQGQLALSSFGSRITKGPYSENDKSPKPYTYTETPMILTDIANGPLPHTHTISQRHVHGVEPTYLYRIPAILSSMKNLMKDFMVFLK